MSLISREDALRICDNAINLWKGQLGEGALIAVRKSILSLPDADDGWISVEKKLPEDGQVIIACYPTLKSGCMMLEYDKTHNYGFVTWMPLPKPYETKEGK